MKYYYSELKGALSFHINYGFYFVASQCAEKESVIIKS